MVTVRVERRFDTIVLVVRQLTVTVRRTDWVEI